MKIFCRKACDLRAALWFVKPPEELVASLRGNGLLNGADSRRLSKQEMRYRYVRPEI